MLAAREQLHARKGEHAAATKGDDRPEVLGAGLGWNNRIRSWDEVGKVAQLPEIKNVNFIGNPIYGAADRERSENWPMVCKKIPQLESIDGKMISASVRQAADALD